MKKMFDTLRSYRLPILGLALTAILFTACSKNDDGDYVQPPVAQLMTFNLAPDKPSVGFALSGNQLGNFPLGYISYSGGYLPIYPGNRELRSFDASSGSTIALNTITYEDSTYYSAFLVGTTGQYRNVVVKDNYDVVVPAAGKAWVRYINAVTDTSATPSVTIAGSTEQVVFGEVSPFIQVNAGDVATAISNGGDINASRTISMAENKIYTVLFVGQPAPTTDPNLAVQIKFIENGTAN